MSYTVPIRRWGPPSQPEGVYQPQIDPVVASWGPAFQGELASYRSPDGPKLDVRTQEWNPDPGWVITGVNSYNSFGPIWVGELGSFRSPSAPVLDVRGQEWNPEFGWIGNTILVVIANIISSWGAAFQEELSSFLPPDHSKLEVRSYEWSPEFTWAPQVVDQKIRTYIPSFDEQLSSFRMPDRWLGPIETSPENALIFINLPPAVTTAQKWPATLSSLPLSYRTPDGVKLVVTGYEWSPEFTWVQEVLSNLLSALMVAINALPSYRMPDGVKLDVKFAPTWLPEEGWKFRSTVVDVPKWEASFILQRDSYRMPEGKILNVSGQEWNPENGWITKNTPIITFRAEWAQASNRVVDISETEVK